MSNQVNQIMRASRFRRALYRASCVLAVSSFMLGIGDGDSHAQSGQQGGAAGQGPSWWMTPEEFERAEKEAERAAKEAALARIAELEEQLRNARQR